MKELVSEGCEPLDDPVVQSRRLSFWARLVLLPVAVIGAVLSFKSLYEAATPTFGEYLAAGFPFLVDLLILGASLQYVAGAKVGRPMAGWRLTAHAGVTATLILNALAADRAGDVPWHVTAPAVWAVLVELTAKQVLGEWKATRTAATDKISPALWLTAPVESTRTRLLMLRTGITDASEARAAVGMHAAAREALRLALPDRAGRTVRTIISRQLRVGSLPPAAILAPLGWAETQPLLSDSRPETILRAVLHGVLDSGTLNAFTSATPANEALLKTEAVAARCDIPGQERGARDWTSDAESEAPQPLDESKHALVQSNTPADEAGDVLVSAGHRDLRSSRPSSDDSPGRAGGGQEWKSRQAEDSITRVPGMHQGSRLDHPIVDAPATTTNEPLDRAEGRLMRDISSSRRPEVQIRRLNDAIDIVRGSPTITGPELAIELRAKNWKVSDRTASRILPTARSEAAALGHTPAALVAANS